MVRRSISPENYIIFVPYNVNENGFLDYDEIRAICEGM